MVAVTLEIDSLRINTLRELVFPLLKTFMQPHFWDALQDGRHMSLNVGKVARDMAVGPCQYRLFGQKLQCGERVKNKMQA